MLFGNTNIENQNLEQYSDEFEIEKLQTQIIHKIKDAKEFISKFPHYGIQQDLYAFNTFGLITPEYDARVNYYQEFWKVFLKNEMNVNQIKNLTNESIILQEKVKEIQKLEELYINNMKLRNKKKNRRLSNEIQKNYKCPYNNCYKVYGSDVSLNLHIKIKHNGGNKTDRQKLAQQICLSEIGKGTYPIISLTFPPGFLQNFRKQFLKSARNK